ncbi:MAG: 16S rRNA (guanine(527)-N(7))-methyltransferase RsmG [Ktedonobacterales bacterium]|nr:16S rRNA (guanine(527)-N(7))-methyltransferase RsmG [Ktedonobacterales bacterium]
MIAGATALGVPLTAQQLDRFARYRELLLAWNAHVNLTAITAPAEVVTRHFLDSLTCAAALPAAVREGGTALLDVGSGAGFPGLPLAIVFPNWHVTLLEATGKKVDFLAAVITALGLLNARALAGRAEEVAQRPGQRGAYDLVTARAVAALPTLLEYCCPFVGVGGRIVAPKKGDLATELASGARAAAMLGARLLDPVPVTLLSLDDGRVLLLARQERPCPPQYPRPQGAPTKRPLGG